MNGLVVMRAACAALVWGGEYRLFRQWIHNFESAVQKKTHAYALLKLELTALGSAKGDRHRSSEETCWGVLEHPVSPSTLVDESGVKTLKEATVMPHRPITYNALAWNS